MKYAKIVLVAGMLAFLIGVTFCLSGCASLPPAVDVLVNVITNQTDITPPVVAPPVDTGEPQVLWPAFDAPDYLDHGYEGENEMRDRYIAAAKAAGANCMRIKIKRFPTPHVAIEVLWWESDKREKYFIAKFHKRAEAAGITLWQIDATAVSDYAHLYDLFKAYRRGSVQFVIGKPFTQSIMAALHCDGQGIKISEPEYRK
jgi:hypothetical protein